MNAIDPHHFDSILRAVLQERQAIVSTHWNGALTPFTTLMKTVVLPEVGRRLGLIPHPSEYYSLDCIYLSEYDTEHFGSESGYPKAFSVIIEHENNSKQSCEEMSKLLLFNSPLKVLITYARAGEDLEDLLARYGKMIENSGTAALAVSSQRILVVFGDNPAGSPTWRSYLYNYSGFIEISPHLLK
ncbi:MAG TPA: hypothetical protein VHB46_03115 [Burkholderiales bacterium]|nr:hypothetical protein [Burkholderiales bacterium]